MDGAKLRLIAGASAGVFAVVGVSAFSVGAALALETVVGLVGALCIVGGVLLCLTALSVFVVARPEMSIEEEVSTIEGLTAEALADLPFDTVKAMIEKRPMASLAVAATTGYAMSRDPGKAASHLRRAVTGLL